MAAAILRYWMQHWAGLAQDEDLPTEERHEEYGTTDKKAARDIVPVWVKRARGTDRLDRGERPDRTRLRRHSRHREERRLTGARKDKEIVERHHDEDAQEDALP